MDFVGTEVEDEEIRETTRRRRKVIVYGWPIILLRWLRRPFATIRDEESRLPRTEKRDWSKDDSSPTLPRLGMHVSFDEKVTSTEAGPSALPTDRIQNNAASSEPTITAIEAQITSVLPITADSQQFAPSPAKHIARVFSGLKTAFLQMLSPPSLSIFISFPIALVPKLKSLFVEVDGVHIPPAPDGQPPLAFIMDTATFVGAASVPLGLICLGSALARMSVPRNQWRNLPIGAIISLAFAKMILSLES